MKSLFKVLLYPFAVQVKIFELKYLRQLIARGTFGIAALLIYLVEYFAFPNAFITKVLFVYVMSYTIFTVACLNIIIVRKLFDETFE